MQKHATRPVVEGNETQDRSDANIRNLCPESVGTAHTHGRTFPGHERRADDNRYGTYGRIFAFTRTAYARKLKLRLRVALVPKERRTCANAQRASCTTVSRDVSAHRASGLEGFKAKHIEDEQQNGRPSLEVKTCNCNILTLKYISRHAGSQFKDSLRANELEQQLSARTAPTKTHRAQ